MSAVLDYIHEFHPYDALFVVPIAVSAWLFWKHRTSQFSFVETLFGSVILSTVVSLFFMSLIIGAWSLIGITAGLIIALYVPICLAVGIATRVVARTAHRKSNASN